MCICGFCGLKLVANLVDLTKMDENDTPKFWLHLKVSFVKRLKL